MFSLNNNINNISIVHKLMCIRSMINHILDVYTNLLNMDTSSCCFINLHYVQENMVDIPHQDDEVADIDG